MPFHEIKFFTLSVANLLFAATIYPFFGSLNLGYSSNLANLSQSFSAFVPSLINPLFPPFIFLIGKRPVLINPIWLSIVAYKIAKGGELIKNRPYSISSTDFDYKTYNTP